MAKKDDKTPQENKAPQPEYVVGADAIKEVAENHIAAQKYTAFGVKNTSARFFDNVISAVDKPKAFAMKAADIKLVVDKANTQAQILEKSQQALDQQALEKNQQATELSVDEVIKANNREALKVQYEAEAHILKTAALETEKDGKKQYAPLGKEVKDRVLAEEIKNLGAGKTYTKEEATKIFDEAYENAKGAQEKKKFAMKTRVAPAVGAVVVLTVAWNRFKALFGHKPQTEEEIEAGVEPEKKGLFSKVANGLVAVAAAIGGATLAMDAYKGEKIGTTGKDLWVNRIKPTFSKDKGPQIG